MSATTAGGGLSLNELLSNIVDVLVKILENEGEETMYNIVGGWSNFILFYHPYFVPSLEMLEI